MLSSLFFVSSLLVSPSQDERIDFAVMRRDLEVMRRILEGEALGRKIPQGASTDALHVLTYLGDYGHGRGRSQAFYIPGEGALFLLSASYPVAPSKSEGEHDGKEPTLWERVSAEVDGKPLPAPSTGQAYDAEKVERLKDEVLSALVKHAPNISQLSPQDHLSVVVMGSTSGALADFFRVATPEERGLLQRGTSPVVVTTDGFPSTVLAMRVSVADLRAAASDGADAKALRARAKMAQY